MSQEIITGPQGAASQGATEYLFGRYRVRSDELSVHFHNTVLTVAPKVVKTLIVLLENAGRFVSKDELLQSVWDESIVEEANLSQNIYALRRLFETTSNDEFIETLPRRGYRFAGRVVKRPSVRFAKRKALSPWLIAGVALVLTCTAILFRFATAVKPVYVSPVQLTPAAERAYALGWYYLRDSTAAASNESIREFSRVAHASPRSPLGYAGEAVAYAKLADIYDGSPSGVSCAVMAEKLSQRALALDRTSAMAHAAKGFIEYDLDGDNRSAAADLKQAVEKEPDLAIAHEWYGAALLWQGDLGPARTELERANELDPSLPSVDYLLALDFYMGRDYKDAIAFGNLAATNEWTADGSHLLLAAAHEEAGQYASAIKEARQLSSSPSDVLAVSGTLAQVYRSMGERTRAEQELKTVERLCQRYQQRPLLTALAYASNGQLDQAFAWLSRLGQSDRPLFALDPRLDLLRHDPRFARWLRG
jgi:DNA-binding winged helix-turn-helix (wHTH) protein/tetratricopeptide (TPR) repeat protein